MIIVLMVIGNVEQWLDGKDPNWTPGFESRLGVIVFVSLVLHLLNRSNSAYLKSGCEG